MKSIAVVFLAFLAFSPALPAQDKEYRNGVVVSVSAPGSQVGVEILQKGGNAVDAAIAVAFALAVSHPAAGNIGGGGFMVIHPPAGKGEPTVIDYRETAPAAAHKTMFKKGESVFTQRAVGVPGTVRGLALAHEKFGKLPWKDLVRPALTLAKEGFVLDKHHAESLNKVLKDAKDNHGEMKRVFTCPHNRAWQAGDRLLQPDLARTLALIAEQGPDAFYAGAIAELIEAEMKRGGGLITKEDLSKYQAVQRQPIHGIYRGYDVYGPPPPSSGGICLVQMLNMLEPFNPKEHDRFAPATLHRLAEVMRRAYADRARYLGDPAFTKIPDFLTSKAHAKKLAATIDPDKATPSDQLAGALPLTAEGDSTTHFSVIDKNGMAVANTYTLEQNYGSRIMVQGGGFLLNNEMMDFNWLPGVTTKAGFIGSEPNQIAPGKRMLSSQTPTILARNGTVVLVTGSPGGRTIINTVLQVVINVVDYEMPIQEAVDAPRLHHQWFPDEIRFEGKDRYPEAQEALKKMGHRVQIHRQGDAHSIWVNPRSGGFVGAADRRLSGSALGY